MPNINLRDGRNRDARVRAEGVGERATVRYVDQDGADVRLQKVLRATAEHGHDKLKVAAGGDDEALARHLVAADADVDFERIGMFLNGASRVYLNRAGEIVYHIAETEVVRTPSGEEKERRPRKRPEPNADGETPLSWTGRKLAKDEALRKFVFSSKLQIVHVNGLTYDFLYGMAKELHEANSLMLLGAGKSGKEPLIFTRHSTPHRGFLEGRINGDRYVLLLHLSKMELKRPAVVETVAVAQPVAAAPARQPVADVPLAAPTPVVAPTVVEPLPLAAAPTVLAVAPKSRSRKPTVREVIDATASDTSSLPVAAKADIAKVVASGKAATSRRKTDAVTVDAQTADAADRTIAKKPPAKRAAKPKPSTAP
ncbi:MAG: hypothetical protein K2Y05_07315 [Hyphomicrobiaceae bacterium]|nr:hypothetical protein [Hyphomicrobiaceae bacterium]